MSIDLDILRHPNRDPGVFNSMKLESFLSVFAQQYQHALVLIDAEWKPSYRGLSVEQIEEKIQGNGVAI